MQAESSVPAAPFETHSVVNQPPPLVNYNLFTTDPVLPGAVGREGAGWAAADLAAFGEVLGRAETIEQGALANRNPPILHTFDRTGQRLDEVEFHPAWHRLLGLAVGQGLHSAPWADPKTGGHVARAAGVYLMCQVEAGVQCPVTMTYGAIPVLRRQAEVAADWLPRLYSRSYDQRFRPVAGKAGALVGMGMTEKQGGSDLRANTTRAEPLDEPGTGQPYRLIGHKWFLSAPMCDAFLVLAQAKAGPSCFFLPRFLPDGQVNQIHIQRLKDKLGNRSNASGEVELHNATAWLIGEEGRGIPAIIDVANYTRLDCALGTSGLMRQAVAQAAHHAGYRTTFQRRLIDQPLMANVLADMAIEAEAAIRLALRLARAYDHEEDPAEAAFRRLVTPAAKYWVCKRGPALAAEAMEVLGGNGYVEESPMPRLYREMPVNSIWEGSGNIMCLDVLRAAGRSLEGLDAILTELRLARGADRRYDAFCRTLDAELRKPGDREAEARRLVERLVLALQGALLLRGAAPAVADAFCASRLAGDPGGAFGTLPGGVDIKAIARGCFAG